MLFRIIAIALALMSVMTNAHAKSTCPYEAEHKTLIAQENAVTARLIGISEDEICGAKGKAVLNELLAANQALISITNRAKADKNCKVDEGSVLERVQQIQELLLSCSAGSNQKPEASTCVTPPTPTAIRTSEYNMCFRATNTNSHRDCRYSFTYTLSNSSKSHAGGTVDPGESTERCSLQKGVNIQFGKWTKTTPDAR